MNTIVKSKPHAKLGFSHLETAEIVVKLNELLANYQVHFHKLQNFHWNVRGRDFFELHEQFENMYNRAFENIDDIAERIRVFGQTPTSTMKEYLDMSEIPEKGTDLTGEMMVKEILADFEILLSYSIESIEIAAANGDVGTVDLVNTIIKEMEKNHWMLTSWLKSLEVDTRRVSNQ